LRVGSRVSSRTRSPCSVRTRTWRSWAGPQFVRILRHQHADAIDHGDNNRAQVFTELLDGIDHSR
jgi:hypothetical protein